MVARTIYEDSVLNHQSKLPWMKRQSTNCQEQVAIDIIMNMEWWSRRVESSCCSLYDDVDECELVISDDEVAKSCEIYDQVGVICKEGLIFFIFSALFV
ncbi:hypothetical protein DY000_02039183 [Brassica cretica]|uniref:Uncharacterized protein n=1 Tax=Brassica cretica TaxID=69181 RepID=A0ABQ7BR62_BRACR|nr:hypothetical protein DY000_02039183 [Brassica cretica]